MTPLFLIGFMAAGKTSVGRALAQATGRRFVDLDDVIAAASSESVAELVARDEPEFRRREAAALAKVIGEAGDAPIVATGGGAAAFGHNLERMRASGLVVTLGVDVAEAQRRAQGGPSRPLLASAYELYLRRAAAYRQAHAVVDTTGRSIEEVVALVRSVEHVWVPESTVVALGERSYPVTIGQGFDRELLHDHLVDVKRIGIVTDRTVAGHWLAAAQQALAGLPVDVVQIEPGEASKTLATYERVVNELIAHGLDRSSAIVALGGGVVGDLAGFVAATLFRGVPVLQLPTTLVAMVDAAIGGKTAVDLPAGKNLAGAFWQPRLVACALATLDTLPARERRAGFGELWKYALLDGQTLWDAVDACAPWAAGNAAMPDRLPEVIRRSLAYKAAIVGRDERELTGHRALLNLGHTVGHAIESATGMLHGEAVGLGLLAACRVSSAIGTASAELEQRVIEALTRTGLPADLDSHLTDEILGRIKVDKKRTGDQLRFIAVREVGICEPVEIAITEIRRILLASRAP